MTEPLSYFSHLLGGLARMAGVVLVGGFALAWVLRKRGLRWTWALLGFPAGLVLNPFFPLYTWPLWIGGVYACWLGAHWHREDLEHGADLAEIANERIGILDVLRRDQHNRQIQRAGWLHNGWLVVGRDTRGTPVSIPAGGHSGSHTLVLGATGSGKTVSEAWIAARMVDAGYGAIVIDPKGDRLLHNELRAAAARRGRAFLEWTPEGPSVYNPYAHGTDSEIADKALSGEQFTEPHYLRQAQRYLGHTVRAMHAAGIPVTPVSLMAHMDPKELEVSARKLSPEDAKVLQEYLDSLTERQRRDLAGVRDRLSILAESDARQWLDTTTGSQVLDLQRAVRKRAVVYMRLDADRHPLLAEMLAAAVVSDLVTLIAGLQRQPIPTVVVIDEFSAVAAAQVSRLFGRARSAGVSLVLGTQEFADLKTVGDGALREQILGNLAGIIAHRQNVPESAELIAGVAGTKAVWVSTQQTEQGLLTSGPSGRGTRRRGYEFAIHPDHIKRLDVGQAVVITPGSKQKPTLALIHHPHEAQP